MSRARDLGSLINSTAAGKNVVINGGFDVWQRGTSFTVNNNVIYTTDRWILLSTNTGGNVVASQQTFTPGTAPVAGYEGTFFLRNTATSPTGASFNVWQHKIENVRTLAGQTVTLSFWAKADSSRTVLSQFFQNFGTGGSTEVYTGTSYVYSVNTNWQRFTTTLLMPSISAKTVGAGSSLRLEFVLPINVSSTIDIWGVQLEAGSSATPFSLAGGDIQGELAKCQRYYQRLQFGSPYLALASNNLASFSNSYASSIPFVTPMRVGPSISFTDNSGNASRFTGYASSGARTDNVTGSVNINELGSRFFINGNYAYIETFNTVASAEL